MKNKVLLISPVRDSNDQQSKAITRYEAPSPLLQLGAVLRDNGYAVDIVDTMHDPMPWETLDDYLLIGITVCIGRFMESAREISVEINNRTRVPVIWGGLMPSLYYNEIFEEWGCMDYIVIGDGERPLVDLCDSLSGKNKDIIIENIPGLAYYTYLGPEHKSPLPKEPDLDQYPVPAWDMVARHLNHTQQPYYFRLHTSRGCPWSCRFCYGGRDTSYRKRSAEHVIEELELIRSIIGRDNPLVITIGDDNSLVDSKRMLKIFEYCHENNIYIEQIVTHLNNLNDALIDAMAGIVQTVVYSIESGSERLRRLINKKVDIVDAFNRNQQLFDVGITTIHNVITGLPTATLDDMREDVELGMALKTINPFARLAAFFFMPLPATDLRDWIQKDLHYCLPDDLETWCKSEWYYQVNANDLRLQRPWLTHDEYDMNVDFTHLINKIFTACNRPRITPEAQLLLSVHPKLAELFHPVHQIAQPSMDYRPYVLDRLLAGEKIDLRNDLKKYV